MRKLTFAMLSITILLLLWGCPNGINKHKYYDAYFPESPVNLTNVNSEFDDYNSALPETHFGKQLIFSSNRRSSGGNFDIIGDIIHATWYWDDGNLVVDNSYYWQNTNYVGALLSAMDKNDNQYAPYMIGFDTVINDTNKRIYLFAYATNSLSNCYRNEFMYYVSDYSGETGEVFPATQIPFLGNCSQQQYISFYGPDVSSIDLWELNPNNFTQMYSDDNSDGISNIYSTDIPDSLSFMEFLSTDAEFEKQTSDVLNSTSNDRCPFVNGNFMVFASDRAGGFGGYDLYYSFIEMGQWTVPINFGEGINTEYDEFRPVTMQAYSFKNDMMIFSSNRPGGLGGFDLYYVGIDKIAPYIIITDK